MYGGKWELQKQIELKVRKMQRYNIMADNAKNQVIKDMVKKKVERMKEINSIFSTNLEKYAVQYKNEINSDPNFRDSFNTLCQDLGVDPLISRKTMFSGLGFGDFYNELAMKILDITSKKRQQNGGMMKITDIIQEFKIKYKSDITKKDVQEAMKRVTDLGGFQIINNEYLSTSNLSMSNDFNVAIGVAEKYGYISSSLMAKENGWKVQQFQAVVNQLQQEGMVWVDKKTKTGELTYYFPSMLNFYVENNAQYSKYLQ